MTAASGFSGAEVGLGEHVVDAVDDERQLVGVIRQPGGVFDHQGGAGAIDRLETHRVVPAPRSCARARPRSPAFDRYHPRGRRAP